ncbi:hypothetical protein KJ765_02965 [Candidatus Micrarchaeota archaeon]|nr:hypothetical protein [Candidatus Micrarchaeota archaeon]
MEFEVKRAGLTLGLLFALMHAVWVTLVAVGSGQGVADSLSRIHFLSYELLVTPFDPVMALLGIFGAFICGLVAGGLFAWIWNRLPQ